MKERPYTQFYAQLLGGFSLYFHNEEIPFSAHIQTKYMQILLMLLKAGADGIERKKLIEYLRPEESDVMKGLNNLRQQVFLLRRTLRQSGLPEGKYIVPKASRYYFSLDYQVETDTGILDRLAYRIRNETLDEDQRKQLLLQYCQNYTGEFLPMLGGEEWVALESAYYQKLYFTFLSELCGILKKQKETEKILELCTRASEIHPYDEWQAVQIDCLMSMNRYREALKVYEKATEIFYEDLGVTSIDKVMAKYRNLGGQIYYAASAMTGIKELLQEDGPPSGAYCCSYPSFLDLYHVVVRMGERTGIQATLMVCTMDWQPQEDASGNKRGQLQEDAVDSKWDQPQEDAVSKKRGQPEEKAADGQAQLDRKMELLRQVILSGIRAEDVYTRYSENQFLVLLLGANEENGRMIAKRLENNWLRISGDGKTKLKFTVQQADGPGIRECGNEEKGNLHYSYS